MNTLVAFDHAVRLARSGLPGTALLAPDVATDLRTRIARTFPPRRPGRTMWERVLFDVSVQDVEGWRHLCLLVGDSACVLFADREDSQEMILCDSGTALLAVLEHSPHFEFYVTDQEVRFLACFNHHDFLMVAGSPPASG